MLARLLLILLLAIGATPVAAMPAGCHEGMAIGMTMPMATSAPARHEHPPATVDHGCIGCAALPDWLAERIVAPTPVAAVAPVALPARFSAGMAAPLHLRPPRQG